jgi:hypothetical protein
MVGQANFSHRELQFKSCKDIKEQLAVAKDICWDTDIPIHLQRGSCCIKVTDLDEYGNEWGPGWIIDKEIPIFKDEGREYIERLVNFE